MGVFNKLAVEVGACGHLGAVHRRDLVDAGIFGSSCDSVVPAAGTAAGREHDGIRLPNRLYRRAADHWNVLALRVVSYAVCGPARVGKDCDCAFVLDEISDEGD